jgi:hypothetical protein
MEIFSSYPSRFLSSIRGKRLLWLELRETIMIVPEARSTA